MTKEEYSELFRKTEGKLFDYKRIKSAIEKIELDIEEIKNEYIGCGAIGYEERTGPTYNISRLVENEVIKKEQRINYLEYRKRQKEIEKRKIEIAINNFTLEQKELFDILYSESPFFTVYITHSFGLSSPSVGTVRTSPICNTSVFKLLSSLNF